MVCRFPATDFLNKSQISVLDAPLIEPPDCFDDHEKAAFWFGMEDGPDSLKVRLGARAVAGLFGFVPTTLLPNARLECIRRLTVCLNRGLTKQALAEAKRANRQGVAAELIIALMASFRGPMVGSLR